MTAGPPAVYGALVEMGISEKDDMHDPISISQTNLAPFHQSEAIQPDRCHLPAKNGMNRVQTE